MQGARNFRIILGTANLEQTKLPLNGVAPATYNCELIEHDDDNDQSNNPSRISCVSSNPRSRANSCNGREATRPQSLSDRLNFAMSEREKQIVDKREALSQ